VPFSPVTGREGAMRDESDQAMATALAGGAIATALLETLIDTNALTLDTARMVFDRAIRGLAPLAETAAGAKALDVIVSFERSKFAARR